MTPSQVLTQAAALLNEDAQLTAESCQRAGDPAMWVCEGCVRDENGKCNARRAHDERCRVAAMLIGMAT